VYQTMTTTLIIFLIIISNFILTTTTTIFPSIFVLNLDRRPDRWKQTQNELVRANVERFERLSAVDGTALPQHEIDRFNVSARAARGRKILPGQAGCALSHARAMSEMITKNLSSVLVLEDDVTLVPNFLSRLEDVMSSIPNDWELLFLGSSGCVVDPNSNDGKKIVVRAQNCWTTHAYAVRNQDVARRILEAHEMRLLPADTLLVELQKEIRSYTCRPALVYQRVGPSDIATFNRGHLSLGHSLYSSDHVLHVWAASTLNAPLCFPEIIFENYYMNNVDIKRIYNQMSSFYWKSPEESTVRYVDNNDVKSFEHLEEYFKHRKAHGFPEDWSEVYNEEINLSKSQMLQTLLSIIVLGGNVPTRWLENIYDIQSKQKPLVNFIPTLLRNNLVRVERNGFVRAAAAHLMNLDESYNQNQQQLQRWRLLVMAKNLPNMRSSWSDRVQDAEILVQRIMNDCSYQTNKMNREILNEIVLRLHTSMLLSERYDMGRRLLDECFENDPENIVHTSRLARHRILQDNSQTFSSESLFTLVSQNRSQLPFEDHIGLTVETGLYYHARGMHGEASREFDSVLDDLVHLVNSPLEVTMEWVRSVGSTISICDDGMWKRYVFEFKEEDDKKKCEDLARETDCAVLYLQLSSSKCIVVCLENIMSFLLYLEDDIDECDSGIPYVVNLLCWSANGA